jgi:hypothetical protein
MRITRSTVAAFDPAAIPLGTKNRAVLLFVQPLQKLLESGICKDLLDAVEGVPQFVVRPGFVDEILAGWAVGTIVLLR